MVYEFNNGLGIRRPEDMLPLNWKDGFSPLFTARSRLVRPWTSVGYIVHELLLVLVGRISSSMIPRVQHGDSLNGFIYLLVLQFSYTFILRRDRVRGHMHRLMNHPKSTKISLDGKISVYFVRSSFSFGFRPFKKPQNLIIKTIT